jgi:hypothetical protein
VVSTLGVPAGQFFKAKIKTNVSLVHKCSAAPASLYVLATANAAYKGPYGSPLHKPAGTPAEFTETEPTQFGFQFCTPKPALRMISPMQCAITEITTPTKSHEPTL